MHARWRLALPAGWLGAALLLSACATVGSAGPTLRAARSTPGGAVVPATAPPAQALATAPALAAATANQWKQQHPAVPQGPVGNLSAIACQSARSCTAVGYTTGPAGGDEEITLAEHWNGSAWTLMKTANHPGADTSSLSAISCTTASVCTAVGSYHLSGVPTNLTLVEQWDGKAWKIHNSPNPGGAQGSYLDGVSCVTSQRCVAVGWYDNAAGVQEALAESWRGGTWVIVATPTPASNAFPKLTAVSCAAAANCTAAAGDFAEHWNGATWTPQTIATPLSGNSPNLVGVSCPTVSLCIAAGSYTELATGSYATLVEVQHGRKWSVQHTPSTSGPPDRVLSAVSCTSSSACSAVGNSLVSTSGGSQTESLAEVWNGSTWQVQSSANPANSENVVLAAVSCTFATVCTAAGAYSEPTGNLALVEVHTGRSWTVQTSADPSAPESAQLNAVSCTSGTACMAVGLGETGTLAERWNGHTWTVLATPSVAGGRSIVLAGVSCATTSSCIAVGSYYLPSSAVVTLAERWNGSSWTQMRPAGIAHSRNAQLFGISCTAASACTAVGEYETTSDVYTVLVERWNGEKWVVQVPPTPGGAQSAQFAAVSCTGPGTCTAVGGYTTSAGAPTVLTERWAANKWTIEPFGTPSDRSGMLTALSCTSATACAAVGYHVNSSGTQPPFAGALRGSTWSAQKVVTPANASSFALDAVSCMNANACTATGYSNANGVVRTLAEARTGGGWTMQTSVNPAAGSQAILYGLSCTKKPTCTAIGSYSTPTEALTPWIEANS